MADNQIATLISKPLVTFYCQEGVFPVVARDAVNSFPFEAYSGINTGLLSFQIQNDSSQDLPSAVINLEDNYAWNIIKPNDYVKIEMSYRGDTFASDSGHTRTTCLFAGLVSEVRETVDGASNTRSYTVTVQGLAKILQNVQLSTFEEATQNSQYALLPNDEKKGIKFSGKSSAGIIYSILKKFILGDAIDDTQINKITLQTKDTSSSQSSDSDDSEGIQQVGNLLYEYNVGNSTWGVKDLINVDIEENTDETYTLASDSSDSSQNLTKFSNYNGSILSMLKDVSGKPFDELYWSHEEGKATLHYRPTPFDMENWLKLPIINVEPNAILSQNISNSDQEQCSVFKLTAEEQAKSSSMDAYLYPVTNFELIQRYGYTLMSVTNDYFTGSDQKHSNTENVSGDSQADKGMNQIMASKYPKYSQIEFVMNTIKSKKFSDTTIFIPTEVGGASLYNKVKSLLSKSDSKDTFIKKCIALNPTLINTDKATQLWNDAHNSNATSKSEITVSRYLADIAPNTVAISQKTVGSYKHLKGGTSVVKEHPKYAAQELMQLFKYNLGSKQAYEIAKAIGNNSLSASKYQEILNTYKYSDIENGVGATAGDNSASKVSQLMTAYTRKLFNWYADNSKYYSGTFTINGTSNIEIGKRLMVHSTKDGLYYEFYIESVSHEFSFQNGWTTTIGVTRGLPLPNTSTDEIIKRRFTPPYSFVGEDILFQGGYFGEQSLKSAITSAKSSQTSGTSSTSGSGLAGIGKSLLGYFTYSMPARTNFMKSGKSPNDLDSKDDLNKNGNADCSSFVWLCSKMAGNNVPSNVGWFTGSMEQDAKGSHKYLKAVSEKDAKAGDIIIYNKGGGSGGNGHTAILTESYHGDSTKVVEMGGASHGGVNEATIHDAFYSLLGGSKTLCRPVKK